MSANDKPKKVMRWRVRQGESFGIVTNEFDARGVIVLTDAEGAATDWACEYHASLAVRRTQEVQERVRKSELAGWKKFDRLMQLVSPTYESFEVKS